MNDYGLSPASCCPGCGNSKISYDQKGNVICGNCKSKWYVRELIPLGETYEEVKEILSLCGIDIEIHPKQKIYLNGFPYWKCTSWDELSEALSHCSCPEILSTNSGGDGLISVDICDDFIWDNAKYRWNVPTCSDTATEGEK